MDLSVVVPCFNEADNLDRLVSAFRQAFAESTKQIELVLVDNGSTDSTSSVIQQLMQDPSNGFLRLVRVEQNVGYGHGILTGLRAASGDFVGWTHADMQTPPSDTVRAFEVLLESEAPQRTIVRGLRQGRPFFDGLFTRGMGWIASAALGCHLYDVNAQPKIFHQSWMKLMGKAPHDFTLDLFLLYVANKNGGQFKTIPVNFELRHAGVAKGGGSLRGKFRLIKRTLIQISQLRRTIKARTSAAPTADSGQQIGSKKPSEAH